MSSTMLRRTPGSVLVSGVLIGVFAVSGCGSKDTPPVCSDADSLKSSVSALTSVKLEQGALGTLQTKFAAVQQDLAKLTSDAKTQFGSQIDALDSASASFKSSLAAAQTNPSAATVAAAGTALTSLKTAASDLESAVTNTC